MILENIADAYNSYIIGNDTIYSSYPLLKGGVVGFIRERNYIKNGIIPYLKVRYSFVFVRGNIQYTLSEYIVDRFAAEFNPNRELDIEAKSLELFIKAVEESGGVVNLILNKMKDYDKNKRVSDIPY